MSLVVSADMNVYIKRWIGFCMNAKIRDEILRAQQYLAGDGVDKAGAMRGLNDWFCESLFEEGHMLLGEPASGSVIDGLVRRGHPRFYKLLEELADLHERKNQNYATSEDPLKNLRECEGLGIEPFKGTLVRLCDKWCRIKNLAGGVPDLVGESIIDTLRNMAIYALLAIILWEERQMSDTKTK
jgi:hypothetical protein